MAHQPIAELPPGIRAFTGDARAMVGIEDGAARLVITSPPYWNLKRYGSDGEIGQSTYESYLDDLETVLNECHRCSAKNGILVVNVNSRRAARRFYPLPFDIARRAGQWELWDHVVWYIPNALPQPNHYIERLFDNKFESCLIFKKSGCDDYVFHKPRVPQKYADADPRAHKRNERGRCLGNVLRIPAYRPPNVKKLGYHVAAYPEELVAFFIECYTDSCDCVLDPFLGSGTTLKVARCMGRTGIGFELNADYAGLIRRRIAEPWSPPDWRNIDVIHSATAITGGNKPRKAQFTRAAATAMPHDLFS